MMKSTACCSSRSRKPQRRYRFSPAHKGTRLARFTSRIAATKDAREPGDAPPARRPGVHRGSDRLRQRASAREPEPADTGERPVERRQPCRGRRPALHPRRRAAGQLRGHQPRRGRPAAVSPAGARPGHRGVPGVRQRTRRHPSRPRRRCAPPGAGASARDAGTRRRMEREAQWS